MFKFYHPVQFGSETMYVGANTLKELAKELAFLREFTKRSELGENASAARLDYYKTKSGFEYIGFRRPDGAMLQFRPDTRSDDDDNWYLPRKDYEGSDKAAGYMGYTRYDPETKDVVPAGPERGMNQRSSQQRPPQQQRSSQPRNERPAQEPARETNPIRSEALQDFVDEMEQRFERHGFNEPHIGKGKAALLDWYEADSLEGIAEEDWENALTFSSHPVYAAMWFLKATDEHTPKGDDFEAVDTGSDLVKGIHATGRELYEDNWDQSRANMVHVLTDGRTTSLTAICEREAKALKWALTREQNTRSAAADTQPA